MSFTTREQGSLENTEITEKKKSPPLSVLSVGSSERSSRVVNFTIGARTSPLSRAQVEELCAELNIKANVRWVETAGDKDKTTSLRELEKTDFFTRELDEMLLKGEIDAAIHSAKDLPDPLPEGLQVAYLSNGLDPRDALVYQEPLYVVATSSKRREEAVAKLFPNVRFVDIRGTIEERLAKIGEVDGVVVAECALIRLKLTHLKRILLPGSTAPNQGKLALVTRKGESLDTLLRTTR